MTFSFPVQIIAIPDGVHRLRENDGEVDRLRISLSLMPVKPDQASGPTVDVRQWPQAIGALAASLRLAVGKISGTGISSAIYKTGVGTGFELKSDLDGTGYPARSNAKWQEIFTTHNTTPNGFAALAEYIEEQEAGPTPPQTLLGRRPSLDFFSTSALGGLLKALQRTAGQRALQLRKNSQSSDPCACGALTLREWQKLAGLAPWTGNDPVARLRRNRPRQRLQAIEAVRHDLAVAALISGRRGTRALADLEARAATLTRALDLSIVNDARALRVDEVLKTGSEDSEGTLSLDSYRHAQAAFTRYAAALGLINDCPDPDDCPDVCTNPPDDESERSKAARKLSAILSYPTLAKFFGFTVDVYVDPLLLTGGDALAVVFSNGAPAASALVSWTAFTHRDGYFGPADGAHGTIKTDTGLVDLNERMFDGTNRYELMNVDATNGTKRVLDRAVSIGEALRSGLVLDAASTQLPDQLENGIALLDRKSSRTAVSELVDRHRLAARPANRVEIHYAEDLIRGIRLDVAVSDADGNLDVGDRTRWRTLMARNLDYGIPQAFLNLAQVRLVRARDDGFVATARGATMRSIAGALSLDVPEELATWTGESLAVPVNNDQAECKQVWLDACTDLAVDIRVSLPEEPLERASPNQPEAVDLRPSVLRYGRGYRFGARACFLNGCGLTLRRARDRYLSPGDGARLLVGESNTSPGSIPDPFSYERLRKVQPPEILLPWDETLTTAPERAHGETVDTLVIRSNGRSTPRARRFLVPSRIAAEQAEQHGMFDDNESSKSKRPRGAFRGRVRAELDRARGTFPVARNGEWEFPKDPVSDRVPASQPSQGLVLVLNRSASAPQQQYHPDPLGCAVTPRLLDRGGNQMAIGTALPFWSDREVPPAHPREAAPVLLELKAGQTAEFDVEDNLVRITPLGGGQLRLSKLSVALAPADILNLELCAAGNCTKMARQLNGLRSALDGIDAHSLDEQARLLRAGATPWTGARTLRLVHAVERPLDRIRDIRLHPVVVTVVPESAPEETGQKWSNLLKPGDDPLALRSQEGGATTFFVGDAALHRKSTGHVRCEATWPEHGPEALRRGPRGWEYAPPDNVARLFAVDQIDFVGGPRIDFSRNGSEARGLSYSFRDGRARELTVALVATSRFTDYYGDGGPDRHDLSSRPLRVVVPCTFRPPEPEIDRIMPVLHWRNRVNSRRTRFEFSRTSAVRLYLKESIKVSGFGEMLGLLFWTERPKSTLCEFEAKTGGQGQKVTQWGHDPIQNPLAGAPTLSPLPRPDDFGGWQTSADRVMMPPPDPVNSSLRTSAGSTTRHEPPDNRPLPVHVLGFEPQIDRTHGPYCEIIANVGSTYAPFVRLGLARYQPNAAEERLKLSFPVTKTAQILPWRTGTLEVRRGRHVRFTLRGPGFTGRRVSDIEAEPDPRGTTLLNVRLIRAVAASGHRPHGQFPPRWVPVLDQDGNPVQLIAKAPTTENGLAVWDCELPLPRPRRSVHYGLAIEELEWLDTEDPLASSACMTERPPRNPQPRSPVFAHVIDLDPDLPLRRAPDDRMIEVPLPSSSGEEGLVGRAREAAESLRRHYPDLVITSGRRDVWGQARAMAGNVLRNRRWVAQTYRSSPSRRALQQWLENNPAAQGQEAIAAGFAEIMMQWSPAERAAFSKHFSGLAFDIRPLRAPGVRTFIRSLPGLTKFLEREGGLLIWHLEFGT